MDITVSSFFSPWISHNKQGCGHAVTGGSPTLHPKWGFLFSPLTSLYLSSLRPVISGVCCVHSPNWASLSQKDCLTFRSVLLGNNCEWSPTPRLNLFTFYWYLLQRWNCFAFILEFFLEVRTIFFKSHLLKIFIQINCCIEYINI